MVGGKAVSGDNYRLLIVNDLEFNFMVGGLAESGNTDRLLKVCEWSGIKIHGWWLSCKWQLIITDC